MREDLNKLMCERERRHSWDHYGNYRNLRAFDDKHDQDDEPFTGVGSGHRESMKFRYGYETKNFSENLNPLYGFIRKSVGQKWDDVYSEICSVFDKRSVINQHILIHLFQYVEVKGLYLGDDGQLWVQAGEYRYPQEDMPLRASRIEYYVDPRDGILKYNKHYRTYKTEWRQHKEERLAREAQKKRVLNNTTELRKLDGLWFEVKFEDVDGARETHMTSLTFRKNYLSTTTVFPLRYDVLAKQHVAEARVAVSKRQLSRKDLRKHGLTNG